MVFILSVLWWIRIRGLWKLPEWRDWLRNQISNWQHLLNHRKINRFPEKHLLLLFWLCQNLWLVDHNKLWKILKEMGIPDHLIWLLRNLYQVKKQLDMEQWTGSKLEKEYIKAVYCHPAYLTYMQSTSSKMPSWMKHKLESRFLGEVSITSETQMTPPLWQKGKKS